MRFTNIGILQIRIRSEIKRIFDKLYIPLFAMVRFTTILFSLCLLACSSQVKEPADLLITNGKVWTGVDGRPQRGWVAIKGDRIHSVGFDEDPPEASREVDALGGMILPGFNDSHVHFASAGQLLLGINLLDVNTDERLVSRMEETVARMPKDSWVVRGDWGAYEAWAMGSEGSERSEAAWVPNRELIDNISKDHFVLVTRYDGEQGLANARALEYLEIESETGILEGDELQEALASIPEKSYRQRMAEARRALEECRRWGVTTVQDMSAPGQLDIYEELLAKGELTCRINFAPSRLNEYIRMKEEGWVIEWEAEGGPLPSGDEWITFGTLKTHIDGIMGARSARFYEPYSDNSIEMSEWRGGWREFSRDMAEFKRMILAADDAGIQLRIHAIGDEANSILLDILDTMDIVNGERDRRFRLVHAQVISPGDFSRLKGRNIIAEVQPYHVADDMRWMEERIGHERCKGAYAFKTLQESGCILSFGSDWPGTNASYYPVNPLYGIYSAVRRQTVQGQPAEGWFPEQRLDLETALRAYTWGSAFGAFEESRKGILEKGKFADIAILDRDLFETSPEEWLNVTVKATFVGGKQVYNGE